MEEYKCCLCGSLQIGYGNDPWPLKPKFFGTTKCCNFCHSTKVAQARKELIEKADQKHISTMYGKESSEC